MTGRARLATLIATMVLAAGCVWPSQSTPSSSANAAPTPGLAAGPPSPRPPAATATPKPATPAPADIGCDAIVEAKPEPYPEQSLPPGPSPTIAGSDAQSVSAIGDAADALAGLGSYRGTVDVVGVNLGDLQPSAVDFGLQGTISHADGFAMDAILGTRLRETNGTGASVTSGGARIVVGGGTVWAVDNISGVLEPSRAASATASFLLLTPEGLAGRVIAPFAGGYRRIGAEKHRGVSTVHYRATAGGKAAYASVLTFRGEITADLWIASDGGYLTAARVAGKDSHRDATTGQTIDTGFLLAFEVTGVDDAANIVELPVVPVADPARPSGPPVDLRLEFQVLPSSEPGAVAPDLNAIGVILRTRLDISRRPVQVDQVGLDRLVVTVCGTTNPEADRRLIVAVGALTVVPLPVARYGSTGHAGDTALPAVGAAIDPGLEPVAPAAGLGLTTAHVDPATGRRGLAFRLANGPAAAFMTYAAAHPDEFVAVVLDRIVLAILPIEGQTAKGNFVFTGDYTEAESRLLASYLYRDPILAALRPLGDVEIPTR